MALKGQHGQFVDKLIVDHVQNQPGHFAQTDTPAQIGCQTQQWPIKSETYLTCGPE